MIKRNLLINISFDGSNYHGFQVQDNALTVCEVFQDAVETILQKRWDVKGCSRTDAGVHAKQYCISMHTDHSIPTFGLLASLNHKLPEDIAVLSVTDVPLNFHARYSSTGKQYTYLVHNSRIKDPFYHNNKYHFIWDIDIELVNREAQVLLGKHDFSSFCAKSHLKDNNVRTIKKIEVTKDGDEVRFVIEGDAFLYNMVRIIVGTLLSLSTGKLSAGELGKVLMSKDRQNAGKTAPAHGLYLTKVMYPEGILEGTNEYSR